MASKQILTNKKLHALLKDLRDEKLWWEFYYKNLPVYAKLMTQYSLVVPRKDWKVGKQYEQGDYVLTSTSKVYKCMRAGNATTHEPNLVISDVFRTEDGYVWKFWDQLRTDQIAQFITATHIPLVVYDTNRPNYNTDLLSILDGSKGSLVEVEVVDGGKNYIVDDGYTGEIKWLDIGVTESVTMPEGVFSAYANFVDNTTGSPLHRSRASLDLKFRHTINAAASAEISITGDGYAAEVEIETNPYNGKITKVNILNEGSDYTYMDIKMTKGGTKEAILKAHLTPLTDTKWDDCLPMLYALFPKNLIKADFVFDEVKVVQTNTPPKLNATALSMRIVLDKAIDVDLEDILEITQGRRTTAARVICVNGNELQVQVTDDTIDDFNGAKINSYNAQILEWESEASAFLDVTVIFEKKFDVPKTLDSRNLTSYKIVVNGNNTK